MTAAVALDVAGWVSVATAVVIAVFGARAERRSHDRQLQALRADGTALRDVLARQRLVNQQLRSGLRRYRELAARQYEQAAALRRAGRRRPAGAGRPR